MQHVIEAFGIMVAGMFLVSIYAAGFYLIVR